MCVSILSVCLSLCARVWGPEVSSLSLFTLFLRYGLSGKLQLILSRLTDQQAPWILLSVCPSVTTPIPQDWGHRCMPSHPTFTWLPGNQTLASCFRSKYSLTKPSPQVPSEASFCFVLFLKILATMYRKGKMRVFWVTGCPRWGCSRLPT